MTIKTIKKLVTIFTIASILTSCSSVPKQVSTYDSKKVDFKKQGEFFGNIKIVYDGSKHSENCTLNFNAADGIHNVAIDKQGNFRAYAKAGDVKLNSVTCYETGMTGSSDYYLMQKKVSFNLKNGKKPTYIGDLEMNWEPGGFNPFVTVVGLLVGWVAIHNSRKNISFKNKSINNRKIASANQEHHTSLLKNHDLN